jgi:hypothetical protein
MENAMSVFTTELAYVVATGAGFPPDPGSTFTAGSDIPLAVTATDASKLRRISALTMIPT